MSVRDTISLKLKENFPDALIEVIDESHLHAGHASAPEGGQSHFRVHIVSEKIQGQSRVARQRMVNAILRQELAGRVHALAMKTMTPAEAAV